VTCKNIEFQQNNVIVTVPAVLVLGLV